MRYSAHRAHSASRVAAPHLGHFEGGTNDHPRPRDKRLAARFSAANQWRRGPSGNARIARTAAKPFGGAVVSTRTHPIRVENPETIRSVVERDPVETAFLSYWVFHQTARDVYVDGLPPRAVLSISHATPPITFRLASLAAADPGSAEVVLEAVTPGPSFVFLSDLDLVDSFRQHADIERLRPAWLYRLDHDGFVDVQRHEVRPVDPSWAPMIAPLWDSDWDSTNYVRTRLEQGPALGIYDGDELVAWYATHLETDRVVIMGFLHVLDAYRGRGCARPLSCALAKEIFRRGKTPACHVYEDNAPSLRLMDSLALRRVKRQAFAEATFR